MLPLVYPLLKASPAVTALCGSRIYRHGAAPQNVAAPYVTWYIVSGVPENSISELPRVDNYSVQVDCWSNNTGTGDTQVEALAEAVRDALEPYAHMTNLIINERDFDTQRFRLGMQFTFWTRRRAPPEPVLALGLSGDETGAMLLSGDMADEPDDRILVQ